MIAVISDTHMPKGERALPPERAERIREAEALIHAGDFSAASVLVELEALHEEADGFQIFNPGTPTERPRAPRRSMGLLHPTAAGLRFEHLWLG